mgnify:CR=1 FL=1|jgi:chitinase
MYYSLSGIGEMVQTIENITKKHMLISYREEFHAEVVLDLRKNGSSQTCKIEFSLELTPLGSKNIRVQFLDNLEYPLIPVIRELKNHISEMDRSGRLP